MSALRCLWDTAFAVLVGQGTHLSRPEIIVERCDRDSESDSNSNDVRTNVCGME